MLANRPVIPLSQRNQVMQDLHREHLGIGKCLSRARRNLWWPTMSKAIEEMIKGCAECQLNTKIPREPLRPIAVSTRPWKMLGTDILQYQGQIYLIVIDY